MNLRTPKEQGPIGLNSEMFRDAPGYNPLTLFDATSRLAVPPSQLLISARHEYERGGRIDITEFVSPAPDTAMHFYQEPAIDTDGVRTCLPDLLAMAGLCATVIYNDMPAQPPRSGVYFWPPPKEGRHSYALDAGELLVGRPKVHTLPAQFLRQLVDESDSRAVEAHRVVANTDQLTETVDMFGKALGLGQSDREAFARHMVGHVRAARTYRRMSILSEAIASLRESRR